MINEEWRENTIEKIVKDLCPIVDENYKELMTLAEDDYKTRTIYYAAEAAFNTLIQELPEGYTTPFISKSKRELKFYTQLLAMKD